VWLCNPNNPTGRQWIGHELAQLAAADPDHQILWVIDEAYRYFGKGINHSLATCPDKPAGHDQGRSKEIGDHQPTIGTSQVANLGENAIIMRSLTKDHSLAGLRLGYAIADPKLVAALQMVQAPWSVNSLAQVAGVAALQPEVLAWRDESLAQLQQNARDLWRELSAIGLSVVPSSTPFALVKVGDARAFRRALLAQGLLVRDCTSFGLPDYIRIAAQLPPENERLVATVKKLRQP
jgi:histidinol-phosphate/aromatic aminotransferase/cobyric acid decarboxylase-like protein